MREYSLSELILDELCSHSTDFLVWYTKNWDQTGLQWPLPLRAKREQSEEMMQKSEQKRSVESISRGRSTQKVQDTIVFF